MSEEPHVILGFRLQAQACRNMGSPLTAGLLEHAAADAAAGGPVEALMAPWAGESLEKQFGDAVALRFAAAVQNLALEGVDPELSAAYQALDPDRIWAAVRAIMPDQLPRLARFMEHEPQTNEVRRCIPLLGGFLEVAKITGLPLRTFEVAASAGLNLSWDHFRYELAGASWGDPASPVCVDTDWQGALPPLDAKVEVVDRAACDRRPTDLTDPDQRRRLLSYYWPDQTERMARTRAAIDLAVAAGVQVEAADAVDWVRRRVRLQPGAATVVYHSVVWSYLSEEARTQLTQAMHDLGAQSTPEAPFAWLSKEPATSNYTLMDIRLRLWPGGDERVIAQCHPHAAWVKWLG